MGEHFQRVEKENHHWSYGTGWLVLVVGENIQVVQCPAHLPGCGVGGAVVLGGEVENVDDDLAGLGAGDGGVAGYVEVCHELGTDVQPVADLGDVRLFDAGVAGGLDDGGGLVVV